jgi:hypothetical protein
MSRFPYRAVLLLLPLSLAACNDPATAPARDALAEAPGLAALAAGSPRDIAGMEAIVATFDEAWTNQDPVTYAAQYAGAEWISPSGDIQTNPDICTFLLTVSPLAGTWQPGILRALEKNILVKRDGEWRIVKHQQTSVAPAT